MKHHKESYLYKDRNKNIKKMLLENAGKCLFFPSLEKHQKNVFKIYLLGKMIHLLCTQDNFKIAIWLSKILY